MLPTWLRDSFTILLLVHAFWTVIAAVIIAVWPAPPDRGGPKMHPWRWVIIAFPGISFLCGAIFYVAHRKDRRVWIPAVMYIVLVAVGLAAALEFVGVPPEVAVGDRRMFPRQWRVDGTPISADAPLDPQLCLAMSGGGIRSAAFNMGVLRGLHELELLKDVEVVSAVSGGTYTLSWLVLQPFYADHKRPAQTVAQTLEQMFDPKGPYQKTLEARANLTPAVELTLKGLLDTTFGQLTRALSWRDATGANLFGPRMMYRNNIQAAFHQTPDRNNVRPAAAQTSAFWYVDDVPFPALEKFLARGGLPFPIFNTTLRVDGTHRNKLWAEVFEITPHGMGADSYHFAAWKDSPLSDDSFRVVRSANLAPAISGAALSSALQPTSDRLRRLVNYFNIDLGYYVPGFNGADAQTIYLSDGGHSENLGVYSLLRRRCGSIIVVDAEDEPCARVNGAASAASLQCMKDGKHVRYHFQALNDLVKRQETEPQPAVLTLDRASLDPRRPVLLGKVVYEGAGLPNEDNLLYFKLALDRTRINEYPRDAEHLRAFAARDSSFPHDPTTNQRFDGARFAAYRDLGYWLVMENRTVVEAFAPR